MGTVAKSEVKPSHDPFDHISCRSVDLCIDCVVSVNDLVRSMCVDAAGRRRNSVDSRVCRTGVLVESAVHLGVAVLGRPGALCR